MRSILTLYNTYVIITRRSGRDSSLRSRTYAREALMDWIDLLLLFALVLAFQFRKELTELAAGALYRFVPKRVQELCTRMATMPAKFALRLLSEIWKTLRAGALTLPMAAQIGILFFGYMFLAMLAIMLGVEGGIWSQLFTAVLWYVLFVPTCYGVAGLIKRTLDGICWLWQQR